MASSQLQMDVNLLTPELVKYELLIRDLFTPTDNQQRRRTILHRALTEENNNDSPPNYDLSKIEISENIDEVEATFRKVIAIYNKDKKCTPMNVNQVETICKHLMNRIALMQKMNVEHNFTHHMSQLELLRQAVVDFHATSPANPSNGANVTTDNVNNRPHSTPFSSSPPLNAHMSNRSHAPRTSTTGPSNQGSQFNTGTKSRIPTANQSNKPNDSKVPPRTQQFIPPRTHQFVPPRTEPFVPPNNGMNIDMETMINIINQTVASAIQQQLSSNQFQRTENSSDQFNHSNGFHARSHANDNNGDGYRTFVNHQNDRRDTGHSSFYPPQYEPITNRINVLEWRFHFSSLSVNEDPKSIDVDSFLNKIHDHMRADNIQPIDMLNKVQQLLRGPASDWY